MESCRRASAPPPHSSVAGTALGSFPCASRDGDPPVCLPDPGRNTNMYMKCYYGKMMSFNAIVQLSTVKPSHIPL